MTPEQRLTSPTALRGAKQTGSRYLPPPSKSDDGSIVGHAVQTIRADASTLYAFWRDVKSIPLWQEHVVSVVPVSDRVSHWIVGNPEDAEQKRIEFDSEIVEDNPGLKIAWKSITEGIDQQGVVTFAPAPGERGTRVTLVQTVKLPGGSLANAAAAIAKRSPRQIVIEDLRHFKQMAETGEIPSTKGQPHGPRGMSGEIKEWMYGENNPTPPGTSGS